MALIRDPANRSRYLDTETGQSISTRQERNLRAMSRGYTSYSQELRAFKDIRQDPDYQRLIGIAAGYTQTRRRELNKASSTFFKLAEAAIHNKQDTSPTGPMARWLIYMGLRAASDPWDVGETPA